jgi:hypothetical protein
MTPERVSLVAGAAMRLRWLVSLYRVRVQDEMRPERPRRKES